jgi:hypothetical protein
MDSLRDMDWWGSGPPRAWPRPGPNFFRGPYFKIFPENNNLPPPPHRRRQLFREKILRVRCNCFPATLPQFFIPNFGTLPKKTKYLALCADMFHPKKWLGPNKKFLGAPRIFKRAFYKCVGGGTLSWNELADVVLDVVIQLNCRPLSYV